MRLLARAAAFVALSVGMCLPLGALVDVAVAADDTSVTGIATDRISVLYRRETADGPERLDPAVQAATAALEREFIGLGYKVIQPAPELYRMLDQGPTVIVTFAPDAGLSLVFSVYTNLRPTPGTDIGIAEVRIDARVFVGRNILAVEQGRGQVQTRTDAALRDFGTRRGYEVAAQKAAAMLAPAVAQRLKTSLAQQAAAPPAQAPASHAPAAQPAGGTATGTAMATVTASLQAPRERWAIIAGVSDYSALQVVSASNLEGVKVDVANMQKALVARGFAADHVKVLLNTTATSRNLRGELKRLVGVTRPEDLVVLFISAHGADKNYSPSGFGMPVLSDFTESDDDLDFWELQSLTRNLPARQVVWIIDTCHAGGATTALPTVVMSASGIAADKSRGRPDVDVIRDAMPSDRNFAVISAARAEESSLDLGARGGLFTTHFLEGLAQEQGSTTLEELFRDKVLNQVIAQSEQMCKSSDCEAPQQTPVFGYSGNGNRIHL